MTSESTTPRSINGLISVLVVLASVIAVGSISLWRDAAASVDLLWVALGAISVAATQSGWSLRRFRGVRAETLSHDEVLYPILLVFLGAPGAVLAFLIGSTVANALERRPFVKSVFNVSEFTIAAGAGGAVATLLGGPDLDLLGVAAVTVGAAVFVLAETAIFASLMSRLGKATWLVALRREMATDWTMYTSEFLLGVTVAIGVVAVPGLAPVAVLTVLVVLESQHRWFAIVRDREQLSDLLAVTTDLHGALTVEEVEEALRAAIHTMTSAEIRVSEMPIENPAGRIIEIDTGPGGIRWLELRRTTPLDPTGIAIIETLSRVAEVSYRMAMLLEERAEQADRFKEIIEEREAFLAATAHQLRTPLTAMVGFSTLLWQQPDDPEVIREMMSYLVGQAGEMTHHLDNLLVSSRAVTDSVLIAEDSVDLRAEAERAAASMSPGARVLVVGDTRIVEADAVRVRQILRNLLLNAEQHGGEEIELRVAGDDTGTWVEVVDDGFGIQPDDVESAFESFRRPNKSSDVPEAAGLGLHVARLLARKMGADVSYRRDGDRSVFRLHFPN